MGALAWAVNESGDRKLYGPCLRALTSTLHTLNGVNEKTSLPQWNDTREKVEDVIRLVDLTKRNLNA